MPSSLRALSSTAAPPSSLLSSATSAASASLRCFKPSLSRSWPRTCCDSTPTSPAPPCPNHRRYCSHASSAISTSAVIRSMRIGGSPSALQRHERVAAGVAGIRAQRLLDTQQLVVLGHAVAAAQRAGLDLGGGGGHGDVGDGGVLGFAGA